MGWIWWVPGIGVTLVLVDRAASWAEKRGWIYWRQVRPSAGAGPSLSVLMELFQPTRRAVIEESECQKLRVDGPEAAAGSPEVDLERNRVRLRRPGSTGPGHA